MLFTSATYILLFLPVTVVLYWTIPARWRVPFLLAASYVFYLSWNARYGVLLGSSTVVNYAIARRIPAAAAPKRWLAAGVAFNLLVLVYFKYIGLFSSAGAQLADLIGLADSDGFDGLQVLLPLAISFFTFEMISVLVDVYRGDTRVGPFLPFAAYKGYFPKLLSGPITRYAELGPQLLRPSALDLERFVSGLALFTLGLAKKLVISNNLSALANPAFDNPGAANAASASAAVLAFGLQIFFDFSAYTDMARGASRMLGLELPRNFNFPYAATSPSDFWRRWHMSLSRWLRDYLYIPLGGNRKGRLATHRNLAITMLLGGLWHGAAWHFAVWGALHGAFLMVSHALRGRLPGPAWATWPFGWASTMIAVFVAWVFFRAASIDDAIELFEAMGRPGDFSAPAPLPFSVQVSYGAAIAAMLLVLIGFPLMRPLLAGLRSRPSPRPFVRIATLTAAAALLWTSAGLLAAPVNPPFIYFRF